MINVLKKFFLLFFLYFFTSSHTAETNKKILEKTINFLDNKVLPGLSAAFIFYQVTKNKIPFFQNISKKTQKKINFYSPISLLTLFSFFRVLNQKEFINKKQIFSKETESLKEQGGQPGKLIDDSMSTFSDSNTIAADKVTEEKKKNGNPHKKKVKREKIEEKIDSDKE